MDEGKQKHKKFLSITRINQNTNQDEVKIVGRITVETEIRGIRRKLIMLNTKRKDIKPLLARDRLRELNWSLRKIESTMTTANNSERDKKAKTRKVKQNNRIIKDTENRIRSQVIHR